MEKGQGINFQLDIAAVHPSRFGRDIKVYCLTRWEGHWIQMQRQIIIIWLPLEWHYKHIEINMFYGCMLHADLLQQIEMTSSH